jgi:hypothetical protein
MMSSHKICGKDFEKKTYIKINVASQMVRKNKIIQNKINNKKTKITTCRRVRLYNFMVVHPKGNRASFYLGRVGRVCCLACLKIKIIFRA